MELLLTVTLFSYQYRYPQRYLYFGSRGFRWMRYRYDTIRNAYWKRYWYLVPNRDASALWLWVHRYLYVMKLVARDYHFSDTNRRILSKRVPVPHQQVPVPVPIPTSKITLPTGHTSTHSYHLPVLLTSTSGNLPPVGWT
jgi:hypothetical protein